jgi:Rieske Fe-S protein
MRSTQGKEELWKERYKMVSDPYFSTKRCVDRLLRVWKDHGNLIVGFDFDDTIHDYHKRGYKYTRVLNLLKRCKHLGCTLIMSSVCKDFDEVHDKIGKTKEMGIAYPIGIGSMDITKKPYVNIMLDDKAGLGQAYKILNAAVTKIERMIK